MAEPLTKKPIEAAIVRRPTAGQTIRDALGNANPPGLGLRTASSGGASWLYRYRPKGCTAWCAAWGSLTLGTWPAMTVEAARSLAIADVWQDRHGK